MLLYLLPSDSLHIMQFFLWFARFSLLFGIGIAAPREKYGMVDFLQKYNMLQDFFSQLKPELVEATKGAFDAQHYTRFADVCIVAFDVVTRFRGSDFYDMLEEYLHVMDTLLLKYAFQQSLEYELYSGKHIPGERLGKSAMITKLSENIEYVVAVKKLFNNVIVEEPVKLKLQRVSEHIELLKQNLNDLENHSGPLRKSIRSMNNLLISSSYDLVFNLTIDGSKVLFTANDFKSERIIGYFQKSINDSIISEEVKKRIRDSMKTINFEQAITKLNDAAEKGLLDIFTYRSIREIFDDALSALITRTNLIENTTNLLAEAESAQRKKRKAQMKNQKKNMRLKNKLKENQVANPAPVSSSEPSSPVPAKSGLSSNPDPVQPDQTSNTPRNEQQDPYHEAPDGYGQQYPYHDAPDDSGQQDSDYEDPDVEIKFTNLDEVD